MSEYSKIASLPYQSPNAALMSDMSFAKKSFADSLGMQPTIDPNDFSKHLQEMMPKPLASLSDARMESAGSETVSEKSEQDQLLRDSFTDFVGQTFFGQMLASLRTTVGESAYFNGGQAEKIFRGQLDQKLTEELSKASADKISDPMYELFQLSRK